MSQNFDIGLQKNLFKLLPLEDCCFLYFVFMEMLFIMINTYKSSIIHDC